MNLMLEVLESQCFEWGPDNRQKTLKKAKINQKGLDSIARFW
jgi:hypothetical protein